MTEIQYTGTPEIHVVDGGNWATGDTREVPDDLAKRLLKRADFQKTPTAKKAPAKAATKAKAPAKADNN